MKAVRRPCNYRPPDRVREKKRKLCRFWLVLMKASERRPNEIWVKRFLRFLKTDLCQFPPAFRAHVSSFPFFPGVALYLHVLFPCVFFAAFRHKIKPNKAYCNLNNFAETFCISPGSLTHYLASPRFLLLFMPRFPALADELQSICVLRIRGRCLGA